MNFPHGSTARIFRTKILRTDLPHIFSHCKSCLNFNKIVFIETISKISLKNVRKKIQKCAEDPCGHSVRKIRAEDPCAEDPVR